MKPRTATRLAWSIAAFAIAATCGELALLLSGPGLPFNDPDQTAAVDFAETFLFPIVGALIAWKRPSNVVGWLLLAYSVAEALAGLLAEYAQRGVVIQPGSLPAAGAAGWVSSWIWVLYIPLIPLCLLYFPSGRLPSRSWRRVPWLSALPMALIAAPAVAFLRVPAPQLWRYWDGDVPALEWTRPLATSALLAIVAFLLTSLVSLVHRYRHSTHEERQQLKWVLLAAVVLLGQGLWEVVNPGSALGAAAGAIAFAGIPVSIGIAILKYRLYDIDLIINRTLVYGALTVLLVLVYVGGVVGLGATLRELANQPNNSLAVAASTLAVAALFRPARARIQGFIDRRFYRRKYDAVKTLESFSSRLRDEIDLDELSADLLGAIKETMQPAHASLWLRQGAGR